MLKSCKDKIPSIDDDQLNISGMLAPLAKVCGNLLEQIVKRVMYHFESASATNTELCLAPLH